MPIIFRPSLRFSVGMYVKPFRLDNVLHMVKPTFTISPFGYIYVHCTLLPHKDFSRTQTQLSLEFQKQFFFCNVSLNLYSKSWNKPMENIAITGTEQLRQQVRLPIGQTQSLDVYYSKDTVFASATLFEQKSEIQMFQGIDPRPVVTSESVAPISPIRVLVLFAFCVAYYFTVISAAYDRLDKEVLRRFIVVASFLLLSVLLVLRLGRLK